MSAKNLEIERLRAVAVLLVVLVHVPFKQLLPIYLYSSFTGVDLFFVISGFVVSGSFMRSLPVLAEPTWHDRLRSNKNRIVAFYLRRVFRILPSALTYAVLYCVASIWLKANGSISELARPGDVFREVIAILSGFYNYALVSGAVTANLAHYWSLSVEEHFYFITPFLLVVCANARQRVATLLVAILLVLLVFRPLTSGPIMNLSHARFDSLFYGVLLSILLRYYKSLGFWDFKSLNRADRAVSASGIARFMLSDHARPVLKTTVGLVFCAILALLPGVTNTAIVGGSGSFYTASAGLIAYSFVSVILVMLASLERGWILDIPVLRRVFEYIGSRSYAIYLSHLLLIQLYNDLYFRFYEMVPPFLKLTRAGYVWQSAAYLAVVVVVSEISYRLIETPFINMGHAFTGEPQSTGSTRPVPAQGQASL